MRSQHQHAQLQEGTIAGEVVEAGTADLRTALDVNESQGLAEFKVVLGLEIEVRNLAYFFNEDEVILTAGGCAFNDVIDLVLQLFHRGLSRGPSLFSLFDLGFQLICAFQQRRALFRGGLTNLLAQGFLLGTHLVGLLDGKAALLIGCEELIHERGVFPTGDLGGADNVWVFTE